uniref:Retrovirus-related Pol polyprotein from transposon 412 family n=1 Tax=Cajanus cajan TaxID=3821 RepID=A0A151T2V6_CAJCA|nr:Retrovirus-related Pol polyprotein from transposon 412 family [Cajanus cajan]
MAQQMLQQGIICPSTSSFSSLILLVKKKGRHVNPTNVYKTAFRIHHGHYEWLVMPFALTHAHITINLHHSIILITQALAKFIHYLKLGKENIVVDVFSKLLLMAWSKPQCQFLIDLRKEITTNEHLSNIVQLYQQNIGPDPNYVVKEGLLYWKSSPIGGHPGVTRTLAKVISQFYWPNMRFDIKEFVQTCSVCQFLNNFGRTLPWTSS